MAPQQTKNEAGPFGNEGISSIANSHGLNEGMLITNLCHAGRRVVLLISTPVGESLQSIARVTGFQAPQSTPVD